MRSHLEYLFLGSRCQEVGASSPRSSGAAAAPETEQGQLWGQRHCKNVAESVWKIWQEKKKLGMGGRGDEIKLDPEVWQTDPVRSQIKALGWWPHL